MEIKRSTDLNKWLLYAGLFVVALFIRVVLILGSREMDKWIDLAIYANGGQLITNGVNPYNFLDNMDLRDSLRRDTIASNYYVDGSQKVWNFYASGNLPLTLLYFGFIENLSGGSLFWYRIIFAIADSILVVWIAIFILQYWNIRNRVLTWLIITGIGTLSPIMLYHGTLLPEDKGVQILLMVCALYFSKKQNLFLASLCLGWAIAFKGFGIFIAPLCLYYFVYEGVTFNKVLENKNFKKATLFVLASAIFALQPFLLYLMEVGDMILGRLDDNLNATSPSHSSIWRFIYLSLPHSWKNVKLVTTILFLSINILGLLRRRFGLNVITASLLLLFADMSLLAGSLDRMNIGFLVAILLIGMTHLNAAVLMSAIYCFAGILVFFSGYTYVNKFDSLDPELMDSGFSLAITASYILLLGYYALKSENQQSVKVAEPH